MDNDRKRKFSALMELLEDDDSCEEEDPFFLSDSESEEEDMFLTIMSTALIKNNRNCVKKYVEQTIPTYTDKEFVTHFRVSRELFEFLAMKFNNSAVFQGMDTSKSYSADVHMILFLWFAAHEGCSFRDMADRFDLCIGTVGNMISRVIRFISSLSTDAIKWPTEREKAVNASIVLGKTGIPGVIGSLDGTHIRIDPPKRSKADYIDRNKVISIQMQGICDDNRKFIDMFVGYPGSVHDSRVFQNSDIYKQLPNACGDFIILADSAYRCSKHVITPYRDNGRLTRQQKQFNTTLSSERVSIEHSFGILKQRFRQLYYCKLRGIKKICHFVRACVVVHNLIDDDSDLTEVLEDTNAEPVCETADDTYGGADTQSGSSLRNQLCAQLFEGSQQQR